MSFNKKYVVLGVVVLFIALVFTPTTHAVYINELNSEEEQLQIEISEYKSDGIIEKKIFSLTKKEVSDLKEELLNSISIEEQLSILKDYRLIPESVNTEGLENDMYKRASSLGINEDLIPEKSRIKLPILLKFLKRVSIVFIGGVSLNIGLKFIIRFINLLPFINLPTLDFADFCGGLVGVTTATGVLSNTTLITFPGIVGMIGFIGYRIKIPLLMNIYTGFSVVTFGLGLGIRI